MKYEVQASLNGEGYGTEHFNERKKLIDLFIFTACQIIAMYLNPNIVFECKNDPLFYECIFC